MNHRTKSYNDGEFRTINAVSIFDWKAKSPQYWSTTEIKKEEIEPSLRKANLKKLQKQV